MRLLHTSTFELRSFDASQPPKYAILSHRWYDDEVTYDRRTPNDLLDDQEKIGRGYEKVRNACRVAREEGQLDWIWIDSCCIDKSSSEEVNRSINSMFRWYREAEVCYTYLFDVHIADNRHAQRDIFARDNCGDGEKKGPTSEWFERGWTLQELLAPREMVFFDSQWDRIGTRAELAEDIQSATGIDEKYLKGTDAFRSASVAKRLSWQAHRRTTVVEDIAYSLIGVLGVSLIPIYGEGQRAFIRLQEAFMSLNPDESLFAWTCAPSNLPQTDHSSRWKEGEWGLLAPSVQCFSDSGDITLSTRASQWRDAKGLSRVAGGINLPILYQDLWPQRAQWLRLFCLPPVLGPFFWPIVWSIEHENQKMYTLTLNCFRRDEKSPGSFKHVQISIIRAGQRDEAWKRCHCWQLQLRDEIPDTGSRSGGPRWKDVTVLQPDLAF